MAGLIDLTSLSSAVSICLLNLSLSPPWSVLSCDFVAGHNARVSCSSATCGVTARRLTHCGFPF